MLRRLWHLLLFFSAARVRSRDELDAALKRAPRYIVVEGTEALRAYAASLAYRGGQEAAALEEEAAIRAAPAYMVVPTVGRIRDGYRQRRRPDRRRTTGRRSDRAFFQAGMGTVIAAFTTLLAMVAAEWLLWPASNPELVRHVHHIVAPVRHAANTPLPTHAPAPPPPTLHEQVINLLVPLLVLVAAGALLFLVWQAIGPGRPVRVSWRVAYRVQGQLVIARIRTKIA